VIFVWGLLQDPTTRSVYDCLARLGARIAFVNHADIARTRVRFTSDSADSYRLTCGDLSYELAEMSAAYLRPYDHRDYADYVKPGDEAPVVGSAELVHHLIGAWAESTAALVINRPSAEATNHSKLFQAMHILASGFSVPASLVTNEPDRVREFQARHSRIIYKSMSSVRSIVQELDASALNAIGQMGPVMFQQRVMGTNFRVHVIGGKAVACVIHSDGVDYRYAPSNIAPFALPNDVAARCVALSEQLGLVLSGIDLVRTSLDEWYCLEVNPNPAFSCYDLSEDKIIARAVADTLRH
jgi:glutathione synthase/RimK-type ligase-like ATP-grasp enzyme